MTLHKDTERVPFCCDYHDRYGDHCLFQYQAARPPKTSDAARRILNELITAGAAVPSWNTKQRQQSEVKILAVIDIALTTVRKEARAAAFRDAADAVEAMSRIDARNESFAYLNGAIWMQAKAANHLRALAVAAAQAQKGEGVES